MRRRAAILGASLLVACAPVPMTEERARAECRAELSRMQGVSGEVGIGVGSGGPRTRGSITITNRVGNRWTPEQFIADCVARRMAGRPPPPTVGISIGGSL